MIVVYHSGIRRRRAHRAEAAFADVGTRGYGSMITKGYQELVAEAEAEVETLTVADAIRLVGDAMVQFIDVRDVRELWREGGVPGAAHCPRGMLEFWVDPASPYHRDLFASGKKFVFFCAGGWRSALAAHSVQRMGLTPVAHVGGGFTAWKEAGGPVETKENKDGRDRKQ